MTSTADARREQARGNGVGQAGQFGHQAHTAPGAFDPGSTAAPAEAPKSVNAWAEALAEKLRADKPNDWSEELAQLDAARAEEATPAGRYRAAWGSFRAVSESDPEAAYWLHGTMAESVTNADYPQLQYRPEDPENENSYAALIDPYTGEETNIVVQDVAVHHTTFDDISGVDFDDPDNPTFSLDYDHEGEFEHFVYKSEASGKPVSLPEGWSEQ